MTHAKSNKPNIEFHKALAVSQWSKRWSTVSLLFLHKQQRSTTMICPFSNLSKVRILPKAANQVKKTLSKGPYSTKYTSKGKECCHRGLRHYSMFLHKTTLSWKGSKKNHRYCKFHEHQEIDNSSS